MINKTKNKPETRTVIKKKENKSKRNNVIRKPESNSKSKNINLRKTESKKNEKVLHTDTTTISSEKKVTFSTVQSNALDLSKNTVLDSSRLILNKNCDNQNNIATICSIPLVKSISNPLILSRSNNNNQVVFTSSLFPAPLSSSIPSPTPLLISTTFVASSTTQSINQNPASFPLVLSTSSVVTLSTSSGVLNTSLTNQPTSNAYAVPVTSSSKVSFAKPAVTLANTKSITPAVSSSTVGRHQLRIPIFTRTQFYGPSTKTKNLFSKPQISPITKSIITTNPNENIPQNKIIIAQNLPQTTPTENSPSFAYVNTLNVSGVLITPKNVGTLLATTPGIILTSPAIQQAGNSSNEINSLGSNQLIIAPQNITNQANSAPKIINVGDPLNSIKTVNLSSIKTEAVLNNTKIPSNNNYNINSNKQIKPVKTIITTKLKTTSSNLTAHTEKTTQDTPTKITIRTRSFENKKQTKIKPNLVSSVPVSSSNISFSVRTNKECFSILNKPCNGTKTTASIKGPVISLANGSSNFPNSNVIISGDHTSKVNNSPQKGKSTIKIKSKSNSNLKPTTSKQSSNSNPIICIKTGFNKPKLRKIKMLDKSAITRQINGVSATGRKHTRKGKT